MECRWGSFVRTCALARPCARARNGNRLKAPVGAGFGLFCLEIRRRDYCPACLPQTPQRALRGFFGAFSVAWCYGMGGVDGVNGARIIRLEA